LNFKDEKKALQFVVHDSLLHARTGIHKSFRQFEKWSEMHENADNCRTMQVPAG
jgi:hypothetical protein